MNSKNLIDGFINEHVIRQGLDNRTEKAYRLDLEHFCAWMKQKDSLSSRMKVSFDLEDSIKSETTCLEDWMEDYLKYLAIEKKMSSATVCRKSRVLGYYLVYLSNHNIISLHRSLNLARGLGRKSQKKGVLSKKESDAFFMAMTHEYESLDSEFRKRICLRDMVMMEILFYHKIEISELLRFKVADYDQSTGVLTVRQKRGQERQVYLFSQGLRTRMEQWLEDRKKFRCEDEYYERMFLSKLGKPLSMKMIIKIFDKYREMAGIEKGFTPKDLKENCMKQYAKDLVMENCG